MEKQNKFSFRAFVSVTTTISFLALLITGVILFITPTGRVAHWVNWRIIGLDKDQWGAIHICFGALFLLVSAFHIYFNIKPLLSYFKNKTTKSFAARKEWIISSIICAFVLVGTIHEIPPFSSLITLNGNIKDSWDRSITAPPVPHAESLSLKQLAKKSEFELDEMMTNLELAGITVESTDVILGELAEEFGMSPKELFSIASGKTTKETSAPPTSGTGRGYARKTLKQICNDKGIDYQKSKANLSATGIGTKEDMLLRKIANKSEKLSR